MVGLTLLQSILILAASLYAIMDPSIYKAETYNWQVQTLVQDIINSAVIVPALLVSTLFISSKKGWGLHLWAGIELYVLYTYVIYSFNIHFNNFFLLYVSVMGLAFYLFVFYAWYCISTRAINKLHYVPRLRLSAIYFAGIATIFCAMWLNEIITSLRNNAISSLLINTGLFTNPVHVLDLAIVLPALFITGILLLRQKNTGFMLSLFLLPFMTLMNFSVGFLLFFMGYNGIALNYVFGCIMMGLAALSVFLFIKHIRMLQRMSSRHFVDAGE
jgi:hypothetical protein